MNNHARHPALGEMVHATVVDDTAGASVRCRPAIVTEQRVGPDGRHTALIVFTRAGFAALEAWHDEDRAIGTWHHEHPT